MSTITGLYANAITPVAPRPHHDSALNNQASQQQFEHTTVTPIEASAKNEALSTASDQHPQHELSRQNQQNIEKQHIKEAALNQNKNVELQTKTNQEDLANTKHTIEQKMDARLVAQLKARDQEVRSHEMAHKVVGGKYVDGVSLEYTKGPDGVNYAKSGEVKFSVSSSSNPEMTLQKMQQIKQAALAPANPSNQDRSVAATANQLEIKAYAEIAKMELEEETTQSEAKDEYRKDNSQNIGNLKVTNDHSELTYIDAEDLKEASTKRSPIEPVIEYTQSSGLNLNVIA